MSITRGRVRSFGDIPQSGLRVNGGRFFRPQVFDYIEPSEEVVHRPFPRLVARNELLADKLDDLYASGKLPRFVWNTCTPQW